MQRPNELFFDLVTLTFDLDILPPDLHAKIQVCTSVRSAVRAVTDAHTNTHTDRRCQNYYTRHVTDVGCKDINYYPVTDGQTEINCILQGGLKNGCSLVPFLVPLNYYDWTIACPWSLTGMVQLTPSNGWVWKA